MFGRLAGHEDINNADRLALDPVMRQVVGDKAVDAQAASETQMGQFETETLALPENQETLTDLNARLPSFFHMKGMVDHGIFLRIFLKIALPLHPLK